MLNIDFEVDDKFRLHSNFYCWIIFM